MLGPSSCRILIVEDEILLTMALEALLHQEGYGQLAIVATVDDALEKVAAWAPDIAVLDLNLHGQKSFPVADALDERGVPFVIISGHSHGIVPDRHSARPFLSKPFEPNMLLQVIGQQLGQ